jgi:hypothetical protein
MHDNFLEQFFDLHHEWLLIDSAGRSFALRRDEIEITRKPDRVRIGFLTETGYEVWRVTGFDQRGERLRIDVSRNFGLERTEVLFAPRARPEELGEMVEFARLEKAAELARLIGAVFDSERVRRVELNRENGRIAQILIEHRASGRYSAAIGDVTAMLSPETLLTTAIMKLEKLRRRQKNPCERILIVTAKPMLSRLRMLHGLLGAAWRSSVVIVERIDLAHGGQTLFEHPAAEAWELFRGRPRELRLTTDFEISATARSLISTAPECIDVVPARNGETIRYHGLPFARVRRTAASERAWFGCLGTQVALIESSIDDLGTLLETLGEFRRAKPSTRRHEFFRAAPEAWLESMLRRDITLLDANLVLSPLYHQFRADRDRIDLLALRKDGRIVIIELKTEQDREMILQAADYWRKIERLRRQGVIEKSRLFGGKPIADAPPICYVVAPMLAYHSNFDLIASAISPEIEIHRFNLAENWRESPKVLDRSRCGVKSDARAVFR